MPINNTKRKIRGGGKKTKKWKVKGKLGKHKHAVKISEKMVQVPSLLSRNNIHNLLHVQIFLVSRE